MVLEVSVREGETRDPLLRRFRGMVEMDGVLREIKAHRYFLLRGRLLAKSKESCHATATGEARPDWAAK